MNDSQVAPARRRAKPPVTWPAFVLAAFAGIGAALYYGLKVRPVRLHDEDLSYALWHAISPALVPATIGALAIWSLLYFGFVRWKNDERGPLYFNLLFPIVLGTLVALPFGQQAYDSWKAGDVKGLKADIAKIAAAGRADELKARAPLTAALTASHEDVRIEPETLLSASARRQAKARIDVAREASAAYHAGYPARVAAIRQNFARAVAGRRVSPEIAKETMADYDRSVKLQMSRSEKIQGWEQSLFDEAEKGIDALSRGAWRPDARGLLFARREDAVAFSRHYEAARDLRTKLQLMGPNTGDVRMLDGPMWPGQKLTPIPDTYN
jgi:hypothetical protein